MSQGDVNGYVLSGVVIPEEVLVHLVSFADLPTLLACRLVCRVWRELVDSQALRRKLKREGHRYHSSRAVDVSADLPLDLYCSIFDKDPYGRNLLKNPCGEEGLKHWTVLRDGGDRLVVETAPGGCDPVPAEAGGSSCFATSYGDCSKEQWVDLVRAGVPARVLDGLRPAVHVGEWYANRFDCGAMYSLTVSLCDAGRVALVQHTCRKQMADGENTSWTKKSHIFENYPVGVRYVRFCHKGVDTKFWAGHYGAKMTGSFVILTFLRDKSGCGCEDSDNDGPTSGDEVVSLDSSSCEDFFSDEFSSEEDHS
ncbi:F-box only protein 6-like [Bacillus rossius redtenbacheri]|uniref:F-box only protein 6-like n=1 Tax=Bacillus rossius redtenbacheri TaxID=93214 RepID=UPI002FDD79A7